jgi:hypothetical protein
MGDTVNSTTKWIARIGAIILILWGLVWLGQGLRLLPSEVMSGSLLFGSLGVIIILIGLFLGYLGFLRRA